MLGSWGNWAAISRLEPARLNVKLRWSVRSARERSRCSRHKSTGWSLMIFHRWEWSNLPRSSEIESHTPCLLILISMSDETSIWILFWEYLNGDSDDSPQRQPECLEQFDCWRSECHPIDESCCRPAIHWTKNHDNVSTNNCNHSTTDSRGHWGRSNNGVHRKRINHSGEKHME